MLELWIRVRGFPKYEVSNFGRVKSYQYGRPRILRPEIDKYGYARVVLCNNGIQSRRLIHRLVAEHFKELPDDYETLTIDHLNGNKLDNRPENLEWVTSSENLRRAHRDGRYDSVHRRQMTPIIVTDLWTGEEIYYDNLHIASGDLRIPVSSIYTALHRSNYVISHYAVEYAGREEMLLYGNEYYDYDTGEYY